MVEMTRRVLIAAATVATSVGIAKAKAETPARKPVTPLVIKGVSIGDGPSKTLVSVTETNVDSAITRTSLLRNMDSVDIVEFRIDHLDNALDAPAVAQTAVKVAAAAGQKPVVMTFRTKDEGGEKAISADQYAAVYEAVLAQGVGDIFDIQTALLSNTRVKKLFDSVHAAGKRIILSHHDFAKTPSIDTIVSLLRHQQSVGADICKIAVMPHDAGDVLKLLQATWTMHSKYSDRPLITMSMNGIGAVSRLAGETFGSALSFGSVGAASAPGQVEVTALKHTMDLVHTSITG